MREGHPEAAGEHLGTAWHAARFPPGRKGVTGSASPEVRVTAWRSESGDRIRGGRVGMDRAAWLLSACLLGRWVTTVGSALRGHGEETGKSARSVWSAPSSGGRSVLRGRWARAEAPVTTGLGAGWQCLHVGLQVGVTQVGGQAALKTAGQP